MLSLTIKKETPVHIYHNGEKLTLYVRGDRIHIEAPKSFVVLRDGVKKKEPGCYYTPLDPASGSGGFLNAVGNPPWEKEVA